MLSGIAQSAAKMAGDLRLLQHEGELLEPFESEQIGSSVKLFDPVAYGASLLAIVAACAGAALVPALRAGLEATARAGWTLPSSGWKRPP